MAALLCCCGPGCLQGLGPGRKVGSRGCSHPCTPIPVRGTSCWVPGYYDPPRSCRAQQFGDSSDPLSALLYPKQLGLVSRAMGSGKAPDAGPTWMVALPGVSVLLRWCPFSTQLEDMVGTAVNGALPPWASSCILAVLRSLWHGKWPE